MDNGSTPHPGTEADTRTSQIPSLSIHTSTTESQTKGKGASRGQIRLGRGNAFHKLPAKLIEQMLYQADPDTFASLVLLNRQWRSISQNAELYAHHLSRCPSFALNHNVITGSFRRKDLERFRASFSREVRRNLFEAYLRPRQRLINIISVNANTSAALPRGEAFRFIFSPNGQTLLALSSSRIYVLGLSGQDVTVRRELKTLRRALSAAILDDGSILAVLSTKHQVNIYGLTRSGVKHQQVLVMEQPPRTISLAQEGTVLAVAYDSGVEVFSLAENALSTDRRAVRCEAVDSLAFSGDGSMLVGSSCDLSSANTVVITAPFYTENDPNLSANDLHSRLWTTQILFPNNSSTCNFVSLMPSHTEGDGQWLVAYDHTLGTFRSVRTDDTRTGVVYFIGPRSKGSIASFVPRTTPAVSSTGDLVAAGFDNNRAYIYGIPQRIDYAPDMSHVVEKERQQKPLTSATMNRASLAVYSPPLSTTSDGSMEEDDLVSKVDWRQSLFVKGRRVMEAKGITAMKWVENPSATRDTDCRKRLVVAAPGGVDQLAEELGEEPMPVDGGRIYILDFDYSVTDGSLEEVAVEVGEREPELLPEQHGNLDVEVALERRRSVIHNRNSPHNRVSLSRSATAIGSPSSNSTMNERDQYFDPAPTAISRNRVYQRSQGPRSDSNLPSQRPHYQSNAGANTTRGPRQTTSYLSNNPNGRVMFHRHGDQRELPHESDADNWVPPPPPYDPKYDGLLTPELRLSMLGTFSESHHESFSMPRGSNTIPEDAELHMTSNITDLTRSTSLPRPSYRTRPLSESSLSTISDTSLFGYANRARRVSHESSTSDIVSPMSPSLSGRHIPSLHQSVSAVESTTRSTDTSPALAANLTHPTSPVPFQILPSNLPARIDTSREGAQLATSSQPFHILPSSLPAPIDTSRDGTQPATSPQAPVTVDSSNSSTPSPSPKSITLTGANLSHRLNYPVPPTPPAVAPTSAPSQSQYIPTPLRIGATTTPVEARAPGASSDEPPPSPTTAQLATLNRRPQQSWPQHRKPVPTPGHRIDPNHINSSSAPLRPVSGNPSAPQDFGSSSRPNSTSPRAAWGAAGVPGSPNFHQRARSRSASQQSSHPHGRAHTEPTTSPHRHFGGMFSSRKSSQRNQSYENLASSHGGVGPHGSGARVGHGPGYEAQERLRSGLKLPRLEPIQSVASAAGPAMKGETRGRRKSKKDDDDGGGRCAVM